MVLFFNPYIFASTIVQNLPYVTDNLVAYWEQSGYSAGTINVPDLSGQSLPIQYSVSTPSTVTSTSVSSNANTSLTNDTYRLNFSQGLTYEVLFTLASVANGQDPTIMFWDPYSTGGGQMMNISATNLVPYMYNANINQGYVYPGNAQLNTGQWYHVMFTSTPQGLWNFYLDGYPTASGSGFVMPVVPQSNYNFGVGNPDPFINQYQTNTQCLAFWDFGDLRSYPGTGSTVTSLSYTATTGTISGTSSFGNSALSLTTTSSRVTNSSVTLNMASTGATFETIFNPSTLTGNIMSFSSSSGVVSFGLALNATSNIQMIVNSVSSNVLPITVTSGVWYHLAVSLTGGGAFSYYIDGLLVTSGQLAQTLPSILIQSFGLGAPPTQATGFTGSFAMARVYNYALTPVQVIRNYQAVFSKFSNNPYSLPTNTANTYTTSSNLLGYWDFTKTVSYTGGQTFVNDLSGSSRSLTIVSSVLPTYTSNGYSSITAGTNFGANVSTLVNYSSLMTAECMFSTGSVSATVQPIIYNTAATTNGFNLKVNQTSSGGFTITGPNATTYYASSNVNVQSTTWYHMLATLDKTRTLYIYINGTLASSFNNVVLTDPGSTPMGFGTTDTGTGYKVALGRVYNIPLTPNQIWNNYVSSYNSGVFSNTNSGYVTTGLSAYWDFTVTTSGSTVPDQSGNGNTLTWNGTPSYQSNPPAAIISSTTSNIATSSLTLNLTQGGTFEFLMLWPGGANNTNLFGYGTAAGWLPTGGQNLVGFTNGSGNIYLAVSSIYTSYGLSMNGLWIHYVLTFGPGTTASPAYANGSSIGGGSSVTNPFSGSTTLPFRIAADGGSSITVKYGMFRIYNRVLSASEVKQNYNSVLSKFSAYTYNIGNPVSIYSNPVYPPAFVLNQGNVNPSPTYVSGYSYGNGVYVASSSSYDTTNSNRGPGAAFSAGYNWYSANSTFNGASPGQCTSGSTLGGITGEWVKLQLPYPVLVTNYTFIGVNNTAYCPLNWTLIGSKDNVNWSILHSFTGPSYTSAFNSYISVFATTNQDYYQYYALVVQNINGPTSVNPACNVGNLSLYGYPQATRSLFNAPWPVSLSSNVSPGPTPYVTTNLVGYWDAAVSLSYSGTGSLLLNDLSGNGNTMIFPASAPGYNSTGAISTTHNGTNQYALVPYLGNAPSTNLSYEALVNFTSYTSTDLFVTGNGGNSTYFRVNATGNSLFFSGGPIANLGFSNTYVTNILLNTWYHIVLTCTSTVCSLYINGSQIPTTSSGTGTAFYNLFGLGGYPSNIYYGSASGYQFIGQYALSRLYNVVLSASQVQTNYLNALTRLAGNPYNLPIPTTGLASGGNITLIPNSNTYVHQFTTSGTLTVTATITANVLVVASGGASGGGAYGGGAGGLVYLTNQILYPGTYSIVVGQGGYSTSPGQNSYIQGLTSNTLAIGGGNAVNGGAGGNGGSGGAGTTGGLGIPGQGNNAATSASGGGGGGAGGPGIGTAGGNGIALNITGTTVWYAGGGAGLSGTSGLGGGNSNYGGGADTSSGVNGPGIVIISYTDGLTSNVGYSLDNVAAVNSDQGSATGLYALKRLTRRYTGPVVRLTDSSGNNGTDFYSDSLGNLSTLAGQPVLNWISGGIPLVNTWYDQSGLGNNATLGVAPQFDYINNRLDFTVSPGTAFFNLPNGTISYGDQSFTASLKAGTSNINNCCVFSAGGSGGQNNMNQFYYQPSNFYYSGFNNNDQYASTVTSYATCSVRYGRGQAGNRLINVNGVNQSLISGGLIQTRNSLTTTSYIGKGTVPNTLGTQLYYIDFFNSNVQATDLQFIENQYINQDLYYSNVMILLHCQGFNGQSLTSNIIDNSPYALQPSFTFTAATPAYPPVAMTSGAVRTTTGSGATLNVIYTETLSASYGSGVYVASASSELDQTNYPVRIIFDKTNPTATSAWISAVSVYSTSSPYNYVGSVTTTISSVSTGGEWVQLQLPQTIVLTSYKITTRTDGTNPPASWKIAGSTNGTTWTLLDTVSSVSLAGGSVSTYNISGNSNAYNYYRIVVTNVNANVGYLTLAEWVLLGN